MRLTHQAEEMKALVFIPHSYSHGSGHCDPKAFWAINISITIVAIVFWLFYWIKAMKDQKEWIGPMKSPDAFSGGLFMSQIFVSTILVCWIVGGVFALIYYSI